jgi:hypothetical protein
MDKFSIKYRTSGKALPPKPIRIKIPGWSGQPVKRKNGSEPQPWHCPPFVDAATYGLELIYPYDNECHIVNDGGKFRVEWNYPAETGIQLTGHEFDFFFPHPPTFYFFTTGIDLQAPPGHAIRVQPHPRFFTDTTGTAPAAVCGHVQTEWWPKKMFIVFKVPAPGQRHVFRKGEPYVQIFAVPHRVPYEAVQMEPEEEAARHRLEQDITTSASHIARNVWHNPVGQEFKDHYKVMGRAFARQGFEGVESVMRDGLERQKGTQPADKTIEECLQLGREKQFSGRLIEARDIFFHVLSRDPKNAAAPNALGHLALAMNLKAMAQNMMTQAIMLQPGSAAYRKDLGELLLGMNRFAEAEGLLRSALQIQPADPLIMAQLGRAVAQQGRAAEARTFYDQALAIDANCAEAKRGMEELATRAG